VSPRNQPLGPAAVLFADHGASGHAPGNTLEAFQLALRLGATGLATRAWVTADGVAVLDRDGSVGRVRRRRIGSLRRDELPANMASLDELYAAVGVIHPVAVDIRDIDAVPAVVEAARRVDALGDLWLCHADVAVLAGWRSAHPAVRLVNSTRLRSLDQSPERRAAALRDTGIDALSLPQSDWNVGLVTLLHRFERSAWGRDAQHVRMAVELMHMGIDGVIGQHVDRMVDAAMAVRS
jgi:glycerophosphoryl diester phosphodiesterase